MNVGDLKPYEMVSSYDSSQAVTLLAKIVGTQAIEYFIALGYDTNHWRRRDENFDSVQSFITQWANREFNLPTKSEEIAYLVRNMTMMNARRKHELISPTTYSLINYHE